MKRFLIVLSHQNIIMFFHSKEFILVCTVSVYNFHVSSFVNFNFILNTRSNTGPAPAAPSTPKAPTPLHLTLRNHFCFTNLVSLKDIWLSFDPSQLLLLEMFVLLKNIWSSFDPSQPLPFYKVVLLKDI